MSREIAEMVRNIERLDFASFMKIDIMMAMWRALGQQKSLKGSYSVVMDKMCKTCLDKEFEQAMGQLEPEELLTILECLEKHKVNKEKMVKHLLVLLSPHLYNLEKAKLIRLVRCLVTFVRQCENYLIDVRRILEERKLEFSEQDAVLINEIFKRVAVLFPKPFRSA